MANSGKELEELVKVVESVFLPIGFDISTREKIFNDDGIQIAELDVTVTGKLGTTEIRWLIECRDRPSEGPAPSSWVEQLYGRRHRLGFNKVTAVSTTGFSPGAIEFAKNVGIELRAVEEIEPDNIKNWCLVENMSVCKTVGDLKNISINIADADNEQGKELIELFQHCNNKAKIFFHTGTGQKFNIDEIWVDAMNQVPNLTENVEPNLSPRRKTITVNYTNPESRYKLILQGKDVHILSIEFIADISIEQTTTPISKVTQYGTVNDNTPIAESIHFKFDGGNTIQGLAIHKITNQADTKIIVTKESSSDPKGQNYKEEKK
jgi:hypothetical protein